MQLTHLPFNFILQFGYGNVLCGIFQKPDSEEWVIQLAQDTIDRKLGPMETPDNYDEYDKIYLTFPTKEQAIAVYAAMVGRTFTDVQQRIIDKMSEKASNKAETAT
jgi:hypothetical protein